MGCKKKILGLQLAKAQCSIFGLLDWGSEKLKPMQRCCIIKIGGLWLAEACSLVFLGFWNCWPLNWGLWAGGWIIKTEGCEYTSDYLKIKITFFWQLKKNKTNIKREFLYKATSKLVTCGNQFTSPHLSASHTTLYLFHYFFIYLLLSYLYNIYHVIWRGKKCTIVGFHGCYENFTIYDYSHCNGVLNIHIQARKIKVSSCIFSFLKSNRFREPDFQVF